jgi:serine/threonine protein kinase
MAILPGKRLGPYEILFDIGAGGMGEVNKARDTRLNRIVAITILPGHLTDRPELSERFDREAKTIASLNHWARERKLSALPLMSFETGRRTQTQSSGQPEKLRQQMEVWF